MPDRARSGNDEIVGALAKLVMSGVDPALPKDDVPRIADCLLRLASPAPRPIGPDGRPTFRWQDAFIEAQIPPGSSVLDLGCGGGQLLATLRDRRRVRGQGIELSAEGVAQCIERGVPVIQADLDEGLDAFPDGGFEYAILEETLQTLHRPTRVLAGMLRVARQGIVSFPNFAHWRVRMDLTVRGRMPVTAWLPHAWHDTPNIHLLTLQDFLDWAGQNGIAVHEAAVLSEGIVRPLADGDNLRAEEVALVVGACRADAGAVAGDGA
jgi:methionine biosynthesis protein MetW